VKKVNTAVINDELSVNLLSLFIKILHEMLPIITKYSVLPKYLKYSWRGKYEFNFVKTCI